MTDVIYEWDDGSDDEDELEAQERDREELGDALVADLCRAELESLIAMRDMLVFRSRHASEVARVQNSLVPRHEGPPAAATGALRSSGAGRAGRGKPAVRRIPAGLRAQIESLPAAPEGMRADFLGVRGVQRIVSMEGVPGELQVAASDTLVEIVRRAHPALALGARARGVRERVMQRARLGFLGFDLNHLVATARSWREAEMLDWAVLDQPDVDQVVAQISDAVAHAEAIRADLGDGMLAHIAAAVDGAEEDGRDLLAEMRAGVAALLDPEA